MGEMTQAGRLSLAEGDWEDDAVICLEAADQGVPTRTPQTFKAA
jgi:hypothetical protein